MPRTGSLERPLFLPAAAGCIHNLTSTILSKCRKRVRRRATPLSNPYSLFTHDWACLRSASNLLHIAVYDDRSRIKHAQIFKFSYSETHISTLISSSLNLMLQGRLAEEGKQWKGGAPNHLVSSLANILSHIMPLLLLPFNNHRTSPIAVLFFRASQCH
jgi:hypothetical protein